MKISPKVKSLIQRATTGGVIGTFFNFWLGRCTFFAIVFTVFGIYGWLHGRDLTSYAAFVTAMQGIIVLHSWKEDVSDQRQAELDLRQREQNQPNAE